MNNLFENKNCFDFLESIPNQSIDLVLTDPPYQMESHDRGMMKNRATSIYRDMAKYTNLDNDWYNPDFLDILLSKCKYPNMVLFYSWRDKYNAIEYAVSKGLFYYELPILKEQPAPFTNNTWLQNEYALHISDRKIIKSKEYKDKIPYFIINSFNKKTKHPNEKNLDMTMRIIKNLTDENDIVLDCFAGSGTTGVACNILKRKYVMCELDENYFNEAVCRVSQKELDL